MEILQNRLCWWHNDRKPTLRYDLIFEKSLNCRDWDSFLLPAFAKKSRPLPVGCNSTRPDWCCRRCHVDGMSCKNGSSKASGKPSSIPQPSNLQTFKLQPNKPNKLQETHLRQRQTTTWWSCHTKVPPLPRSWAPKILSPRGRTSSGAMMPSAAPRAPRHCSNYAL